MQVPEVDTAIRSLTVMWDGSLVIASNNKGTCYVWRVSRKKNQVLDIIHDTTIQDNCQKDKFNQFTNHLGLSHIREPCHQNVLILFLFVALLNSYFTFYFLTQ